MAKKSVATKKARKKSSLNRLPRPVIVGPQTLPLLDENFTWENFEKFSRSLIKLLNNKLEPKAVGTKGQAQYGIDSIVQDEKGNYFFIQNKKYKSFSVAQFAKAQKALTLSEGKAILFLSCVASAELRLKVRGNKVWDIWDVNDITEKVLSLDEKSRSLLITRYFGKDWAKAFCNYDEFSSLVSPTEFFSKYFDRKKLFNHTMPFFGRDDEVGMLKKFIKSSKKAFILNAVGGIGKSRLLLEFSNELNALGWSALFIREGRKPTSEHFQNIEGKNIVFIFDDAHRYDPAEYLGFIFDLKINFKVLFSTRPQSKDKLKLDLRKNNLESQDFEEYELKKLSNEKSLALVEKLLPEISSQHKLSLSKIFSDSTLVGTLAINLIKRQSITLASLASDDDIKGNILNSFKEELAGNINPEIRKDLIQKVLSHFSAFSPVKIKEDGVDSSFIKLINENENDVKQSISELLYTGVLIDRNNRLRISPDLLSDCILEDACYLRNGNPKGFFDEAFKDSHGYLRGNLLKNIAELDWRKKGTEVTNSILLKDFWGNFNNLSTDSLESIIDKADTLKTIAYFQPIESYVGLLELVKVLSDQSKSNSDYRILGLQKSVVRIARDILLAGYRIEEVMLILWELGRNDDRNLNQTPDHAVRQLKDICSYDQNLPVVLYEKILKGLIGILNQYVPENDAHEPVSILKGFLSKTAQSSYSEGHTIHFNPFHISYENTKNLRSEALSQLYKFAISYDLKIAHLAVDSLETALTPPDRPFGLKAKKEHIDSWNEEIKNSAQLFFEIFKKTKLNLVKVHIRAKLNRVIKYRYKSVIAPSVKKFLKENPPTLEEFKYAPFAIWSFEDVLAPNGRKSYERIDLEINRRVEYVSNQVLKNLRSNGEILEFIELVISDLLQVKENIEFHTFASIVSDHVDNHEMCKDLLKNNSDKLERYFHLFLEKVAQTNSFLALKLMNEAINLQNQTILCSIAFTYWWIFRENIEDISIQTEFDKLLNHSSGVIRINALDGFRRLSDQKKDELILSKIEKFPITTKGEAKVIFGLINPYCLKLKELSDESLRMLLRKLQDADEIGDYWMKEFIAECGRRIPYELVDMLLHRVGSRKTHDVDFRALPYDDLPVTELKLDSIQLREVLKKIVELLNQEDADTYYLPKLFYSLSRANIAHSLDFVSAYITSGDLRSVEIGMTLLKEFDEHTVFSKQEMVRDLLSFAESKGAEYLDEVKYGLNSMSRYYTKSGTAGQPMPQDVAVVEGAKNAISKSTLDVEKKFYEELKLYGEKEIERSLNRDLDIFDEE